MRIAVLGWGSLIKTAHVRGLEISSDWKADGPVLPIEFSRISQSGDRAGILTLVLDEQNGTNVSVYYAVSSNVNLNEAIKNLRIVENISLNYSISYVNLLKNSERKFARKFHRTSCETIRTWAQINNFEGVVWTSLLPNFETISKLPFTVENAVRYVADLPEPLKTRAMEYIRESPVSTPVRKVLCPSDRLFMFCVS